MNRTVLASLITLSALGVACDPSPAAGSDAAPALDCPSPTTGPTMHGGDLAADEVWTADASPHIVESSVNVRDGHKLTIEGCAHVQIAQNQGINVAYPLTPNTGALTAEGTASRPIIVEPLGADHWSNIYIAAPGTVKLSHVELRDGGGGGFHGGATIVVAGDGVLPADPELLVDHVTIKGSVGAGLQMTNGATFIAGSQELTVTSSGNDDNPFPVEIDEHSMDLFPTGHYTGNKVDEVLLTTTGIGAAGVGLTVDATLHDRGVPYRVGRYTNDSFYLGGKDGAPLATLTIEPGVVMRFAKGAALYIEKFTGTQPAQAALRAIGTAAKPIVFSSAEPTPAAGDWTGLWFGEIPSAQNKIDFARIEYAGGECLCSLSTCSQNNQSEGEVILAGPPPAAFITNTTFANSAQHAVTEGFVGEPLDFKSTNTFDAIAGCPQTLPLTPAPGSCPAPQPTCD